MESKKKPPMSAETIPLYPAPTTAAPSEARISVEEYLERERHSEVRHEYIDGIIRAMSGETPTHNLIAGNLYRKLGNAFEDRPCTPYFEGVRLRVTPTRYRYPDVMALCDEPQLDTANPPAVLNPAVIFEVLSSSTEDSDREDKWMEYRQIATLTDYVLVAQDEVLAIQYTRRTPTEWTVTEYHSLSDTLCLAAMDISVTLSEIYRKTSFVQSV